MISPPLGPNALMADCIVSLSLRNIGVCGVGSTIFMSSLNLLVVETILLVIGTVGSVVGVGFGVGNKMVIDELLDT